jgi:hypothetical protein
MSGPAQDGHPDRPTPGGPDSSQGTRDEDLTGRGVAQPAGPHATDDLTDHDKTPGTGALPDPGDTDQNEADPGSG